MAKKNTTPRSYTLRLRGTNKNDSTWREHLWRTHAAVNLGAKIFGDFLLTFCGGIRHTLVDGFGDQKFDGQKGMGARKDRRIILALSWLSVEDRAGAPAEYIVSEKDGGKDGKQKKGNTKRLPHYGTFSKNAGWTEKKSKNGLRTAKIRSKRKFAKTPCGSIGRRRLMYCKKNGNLRLMRKTFGIF